MARLKGWRTLRLAIGAMLLSQLLGGTPARAINERAHWPWGVRVRAWQEAEVWEALEKGWYLNVGPTGIRARITHEHPASFTVRYVFEDSPAHGRIHPGDIIVGANGEVMETPHQFGRGRGIDGWDGPLVEMARLIEDSQANDGQLELIVWRNGNEEERETVALQIRPRERFSRTFPFDCSRSDDLVAQLTAALVAEYERNGNRWGDSHVQAHSLLALMASGEPEHEAMIQEFRREAADYRTRGVESQAGLPAWEYGYMGVVLGELFTRYADERLLPAIESLGEYYVHGADPASGSYSHKPFPAIRQRVAHGGGLGYGPMATPGGLAMLAMSIWRVNGLGIPTTAHERLHQSYLRNTFPDGVRAGYSFRNRDAVVIALEDGSRARSPRGCGFFVQQGMENLGAYTVRHPRNGSVIDPPEWLTDEADTNLVYDISAPEPGIYGSPHVRYIVRKSPIPEPEGPFETTRGFARAATGVGALAHLIGNDDRPSWGYLGDHAARSCALDPRNWLSGHASSSIHQLWVALAAARAGEDLFREFMEQVRWWFVMQEDHRGTYFVVPDRDYVVNSDIRHGPHMLPTANAAIILSLPRRQLLITGADVGTAEAPESGAGAAQASATRRTDP